MSGLSLLSAVTQLIYIGYGGKEYFTKHIFIEISRMKNCHQYEQTQSNWVLNVQHNDFR